MKWINLVFLNITGQPFGSWDLPQRYSINSE